MLIEQGIKTKNVSNIDALRPAPAMAVMMTRIQHVKITVVMPVLQEVEHESAGPVMFQQTTSRMTATAVNATAGRRKRTVFEVKRNRELGQSEIPCVPASERQR